MKLMDTNMKQELSKIFIILRIIVPIEKHWLTHNLLNQGGGMHRRIFSVAKRELARI